MATTADASEWKQYFPEIDSSGLTDVYIIRRLDEAEEICGRGHKRKWFYLTAHLVTYLKDAMDGKSSTDGGTGEHTQETVGRMTVYLKTMADRGADTFYTTTSYGRVYLTLRDTSVNRIFSVRV